MDITSDMVFLDSGAYSAFSRDETIDIEKYIQFIKDNGPYGVEACLDVIGNKDTGPTWETAMASEKNQRIMEDAGTSPIPVYHRGEEKYKDDESHLRKMVEEYDYIGLGTGRALGNRSQLTHWLDRVFEDIICDSQGRPKCKIHGFAVTSKKLLARYPWYSVDSNSPTIGAAFGKIFLPKPQTKGGFDYTDMVLITISNQANHPVGSLNTFLGRPKSHRIRYEELFEKLGFIKGQIQGKKKRKTNTERTEEDEGPSMTPMDLGLAEESPVNGDTLANSWEERLKWNLTVWGLMSADLATHTLATGEKYKTRIYSVCASKRHLEVAKEVKPHPRLLISYVYIRGREEFIEKVHNYQNQ
jgi:hypothetical protein